MPTDFLAPHRSVLEQVLHDLQSNRDDLIRQVTADIDKQIEAVNSLLGISAAPTPVQNGSEIHSPVDPATSKPSPTQAPEKESLAPAPARVTTEPRTFDPQHLLEEFKRLELKTAIQKLLEQHPEQTFDTSALVFKLYGEFTGEQKTKANQRIGKTASAGARRGEWRQVSQNPNFYQSLDD